MREPVDGWLRQDIQMSQSCTSSADEKQLEADSEDSRQNICRHTLAVPDVALLFVRPPAAFLTLLILALLSGQLRGHVGPRGPNMSHAVCLHYLGINHGWTRLQYNAARAWLTGISTLVSRIIARLLAHFFLSKDQSILETRGLCASHLTRRGNTTFILLLNLVVDCGSVPGSPESWRAEPLLATLLARKTCLAAEDKAFLPKRMQDNQRVSRLHVHTKVV
ncbi:hypothetical protein BR93DRAFT_147434 [Coniochaeta sp. PMI_546]|nr:hypothetical protein BR93DRAFT_147434 [Coniochaeta sp. PMI_546]